MLLAAFASVAFGRALMAQPRSSIPIVEGVYESLFAVPPRGLALQTRDARRAVEEQGALRYPFLTPNMKIVKRYPFFTLADRARFSMRFAISPKDGKK